MTRNVGFLVESPGTAPGSDPLITCAFITIVRFDPDRTNIGGPGGDRKGAEHGGARAVRAATRAKTPIFAASRIAAIRMNRTHAAATGKPQFSCLNHLYQQHYQALPSARSPVRKKTPGVFPGRLSILTPTGSQKPDLIFWNSATIRSRSFWSSGVCASKVVVTGSTSWATSSSCGIAFSPTVLVDA